MSGYGRRGATAVAGLYLLASALGLTGCASTGNSYAQTSHAQTAQADYEFMDRHGDLKLIRKDKDLYLENVNGSKPKRITHSPNKIEIDARFSKNGEYICYALKEYTGKEWPPFTISYYLQPTNGDDSKKKIIDKEEYWNWIKEE